MFTGIVEAVGSVAALAHHADGGARLVLGDVPFAGTLKLGDSVAVNGCCLTVVAHDDATVAFDLLQQTLDVTNLGRLAPADPVNLERALAAGARFDGHFVQGHIDRTAGVLAYESAGQDHRLVVAIPEGSAQLFIPRGSITVDGISLTIAERAADAFTCWITPHTHAVTALRAFTAGRLVNLEFDMIVKAVDHIIAARASA